MAGTADVQMSVRRSRVTCEHREVRRPGNEVSSSSSGFGSQLYHLGTVLLGIYEAVFQS